jgi:hypothetical protein
MGCRFSVHLINVSRNVEYFVYGDTMQKDLPSFLKELLPRGKKQLCEVLGWDEKDLIVAVGIVAFVCSINCVVDDDPTVVQGYQVEGLANPNGPGESELVKFSITKDGVKIDYDGKDFKRITGITN